MGESGRTQTLDGPGRRAFAGLRGRRLETVTAFDPQGRALTYEARYADIVANERILTTSTLHTDDQLSTVSVTSVEFRAEDSGAWVVLTEHGIYLPGQEQPEWREHGTAAQLDSLAAEFAANHDA